MTIGETVQGLCSDDRRGHSVRCRRDAQWPTSQSSEATNEPRTPNPRVIAGKILKGSRGIDVKARCGENLYALTERLFRVRSAGGRTFIDFEAAFPNRYGTILVVLEAEGRNVARDAATEVGINQFRWLERKRIRQRRSRFVTETARWN